MIPTVTEMMVQRNPTISAINTDWRVPAINWEKTSCPKDVVPSRWVHETPAPDA